MKCGPWRTTGRLGRGLCYTGAGFKTQGIDLIPGLGGSMVRCLGPLGKKELFYLRIYFWLRSCFKPVSTKGPESLLVMPGARTLKSFFNYNLNISRCFSTENDTLVKTPVYRSKPQFKSPRLRATRPGRSGATRSAAPLLASCLTRVQSCWASGLRA